MTGEPFFQSEGLFCMKATELQEHRTCGASQPADSRLRDARNCYECADDWRKVSYAMHAHARLNAQAAGKVFYDVPAVDRPATRCSPT